MTTTNRLFLTPSERRLTDAEQAAIRTAARHASSPATVLALRSGGKELAAGSEERAELLQAAVDRKDVSIEVEILAYEQKKDEPNRNFVRFRDAAMTKLGSSGKGTPFLRDHMQWNSTAIGGRVVASKTTKVEAGHYQIHQTVRITEPSAVERALRGLMSAVSIGWEETAPVICTACGSEVFNECWHWPGAVITREDGTEERVEWEYTGAALVETSEVPIGGVPTAGLEGIRAALAARGNGTEVVLPHGGLGQDHDEQRRHVAGLINRGRAPQEHDEMKTLKEALAAKLGIGATASDDEIVTAVTGLTSDRTELAIVTAERDRLATENEGHRETARKSKENDFIRDALSSGRILKIDEEVWREHFANNETRAVALMAKRAAHQAAPIGAPLQSTGVDPTPRAPQLDQVIATGLAAGGVNVNTALAAASLFGAADPQKAVAASIAATGGKVA